MNAATLLSRFKRCVPEFAADELFLDLPYIVFSEFAAFVISRIRELGTDDAVVRRSFELVNELFAEGDRESVNLIETTLFEQLADDRALAASANALLDAEARRAFAKVARWAGGV